MGSQVKYKLEVIREENKLPMVQIIQQFEDHWEANTFDDMDDRDDIFHLMQDWCEENQCGHRTSYDQFKFRNEEQLLMFVLRWSQ